MTLLHTSTALASIRAVLGNESLATNVALSRLPRIAHLDSILGDIMGARYVLFLRTIRTSRFPVERLADEI